MIAEASSVFQRRRNIPGLKHRVVGDYLVLACPVGQKIKNVADPDPQPTQAWAAAALCGIDGYAVKFAHVVSI